MKSLLVVVGLLAVGCGGTSETKESVVAEVGGRPIKMREVTDWITGLQMNYQSAADELAARRKYLNRLIEDELLVVGGYARMLDADIGIVQEVDAEKDKFLLDELYRTEVIDKAPVTEAELRAAYDRLFDRVRFRHILVPSRELADSILAMIKSGTNFGDLAEKYSFDQDTRFRGGDPGRDFAWAEMPRDLADVVFALADSAAGGPVKTEAGWHVVQVVSKRQLPKRDFESVRAMLEANLRRNKQQERRLAHLEEIRSRAKLTYDPDVLALWRTRWQAVADTFSGPRGYRPSVPPSHLSETEKGRVIYHFGLDQQVTLGEFCAAYEARPLYDRPDPNNQEQVEQFAFQNSLYDILREEALRLHLDESPIYKDRVKRHLEQIMSDRMRKTILVRGIVVSDPEIRTFYEAHRDSFVEPTAYHVREIMVYDEKLALEILSKAQAGKPFDELARKYTEHRDLRNDGGDLGWVSPTAYPDLYEPASTMKPGEVAGPFAGVDQYSLLQLLEVRPAQQRPFADVGNVIFERLQKRREDSVRAAFIDSIRVQHPVIIYEDILKSGLTDISGRVDTAGAS